MLIFIDIIKKDKASNVEYKNIKKSENQKVEILAKLKSRNLPKSRFESLSKSKKILSTGTMKKSKFLTLITRVKITKLSQAYS